MSIDEFVARKTLLGLNVLNESLTEAQQFLEKLKTCTNDIVLKPTPVRMMNDSASKTEII
jgi:hypothetical protein